MSTTPPAPPPHSTSTTQAIMVILQGLAAVIVLVSAIVLLRRWPPFCGGSAMAAILGWILCSIGLVAVIVLLVLYDRPTFPYRGSVIATTWTTVVFSLIGIGYLVSSSTCFQAPDAIVRISGSTTLGENFALDYVLAICRLNGATAFHVDYGTPSEGITIVVDATFDPHQPPPEMSFQGISSVRFIIDSRGSEYGLRELLAGRADLAMASTDIGNTNSRSHLGDVEGHAVGRDAIAIFVNRHREGDLQSLDMTGLRAALTSRDGTWHVICRRNSGTTNELKREIGLPLESDFSCFKVVISNAAMIDEVSRDPLAIGYASFSFLRDNTAVRLVPIVKDAKANKKPSVDTIVARTCAMVRNLYVYIPSDNRRDRASMIARLLYDQAIEPVGQGSMQRDGFVSVNEFLPVAPTPPQSDCLPSTMADHEVYAALVRSQVLARYIVLFDSNRDAPGSSEMDALQAAVAGWAKGTRVVLFGHTDSTGDPRYNLGLSLLRAQRVEELLNGTNASVASSFGVGQEFPKGNARADRRVEIYFESDIPARQGTAPSPVRHGALASPVAGATQ